MLPQKKPTRKLILAVSSALLALVATSLKAKDAQLPLAAPLNATTVSRVLADTTVRSAAGNEIELLEFKAEAGAKAKAKFRFLVQGGLHGNEQLASEFVVWLARRYARGESLLNQLSPGEVDIDFLPYANPDGYHGHTRANANGVNLNRNFAVLWGVTRENPGQGSFSEPETRAIRKLFASRRYTAAVDVHGYINWVVAPSSPVDVAGRGVRPTKEQAQLYRQWLGSLRTEMQVLPGYQLKTGAALGDGGAFEDWAFWEQGTLAWCLELETFQRYVTPYRREFADPTSHGAAPKVDLYKRYEAFVHRMFAAAIEIKTQNGAAPSDFASQ